MAHDSRNPHVFVDGPGNVASGDQVMDNFDSVWAGLDSAIAGVAASLDAPVITTAVSGTKVRDVGEANQIRAGRVLTVADFTNLGLAAPLGLWNLSNVNDSSGAARNLTNKGTVTFGSGIAGAATEAAIFTGSTAQALYISDTGAADPFRIKTGSFGCWFRTAKRGTLGALITKFANSAGNNLYMLRVNAVNTLDCYVSVDGTNMLGPSTTSDIADDRWHFTVVTFDGTRLRAYVDGAIEAQYAASGPIASGAAPFNIGSTSSDASVTGTSPHYGRVDEAFVTADVLSPEQVLNLYCARITHPLGSVPAHTIVRAGRQRRGGVLAVSDFPTQPTRLHNFTAGSLADSGSGGVALVPGGGGTIVAVGAADGTRDGAQSFSGAHVGLVATDTGLPSGTASRSTGAWFKTTSAATAGGMVCWGTGSSNMVQLSVSSSGTLALSSGADVAFGPFVADGLWHFAVGVEDNAAADGVKRKLYLDGRCVGGSTVLNSITLLGAGGFRVGSNPGGGFPFAGQIDAPFAYAGALTDVQVRALYNVGSLTLARSPKAEGDHVEALEASSVLAHFDALEGCDLVDLSVVG